MSTLSGTGYPIARPTGVCAATGRAIPVGETCIAVLVERADGQGMERMDFDLAAWQNGARPAAPLLLVGSWRTVVSAPDNKKQRFLDDDELLDLFEQLEGAEDPRRLAFRYVLALLLIRRRLLRHEGTSRDDAGRAVLRASRRKAASAEGGPVYHVTDPGMSDEGIAAAIDQLAEIMPPEGPGPGPAESRT